MTLDHAFRVSALLMAAASFVGLILTEEVPTALAIVGWAAFGLTFARTAGWSGARWDIRPSPIAGNVLILLAFAAFVADLLWISQDLLPASIHFLVLLMAYKLLSLHHGKDFLHLAGMSLLALLAAASMTGELWFGVVLTIFLMTVTWTLLLAHLRGEEDERRRTDAVSIDSTAESAALTARFFWTTNAMAAGALVLTVAIFFLIPRISAGLFQKPRGEVVRTSGFSEKVDLGMIGAIKLDQSIVMRVEFPDGRPGTDDTIYFRGLAYDLYTGRAWSNTSLRRKPLPRDADGRFVAEANLVAAVRQDILVEALDTAVLFGMPMIGAIGGRFQLMQADGMGDLYAPFPPPSRFQYSVWSVPGRLVRADHDAVSVSYPAAVRDRFLQLPPLSRAIGELARDVTRDATTIYQKAMALERHLKTGYRYSLDVGTPTGAESVEEFLFTRKTGYCEHYASAMVVMLRTLGIPARLATGFLSGEWNDFGAYYTVRQRDAHAWVEIYFPRSGWITFDPTPSAGTSTEAQLSTTVARLFDSFRMRWDRLIIQYSLQDQFAIAHGLQRQGERMRSRLSDGVAAGMRAVQGTKEWLAGLLRNAEWMLAVIMVIAGIIAVAAVLILRTLRRLRLSTAGGQIMVKLYARLLRLAAKRGIVKPPGMTPTEFTARVARDWPAAASRVRSMTELYCRIRFGQYTLRPEDLRDAEALLAELRSV
ncbi:MAG TPA: DUF3488 and transglutaminase-like domain-containing protein [Nitrospirales bacterium]|nr:DUF3488 and transglutaminase-like domain-containing protein [Nitrospirales bacterium]